MLCLLYEGFRTTRERLEPPNRLTINMRISENKIAEIAAAADIVQIISDYVSLKKAGKDYRGLCPFHGDKDPSFYVSPQKGIFHCFGCAVGGNVFNFVMRVENVTFTEAAQILARKYGVTLTFDERSRARADERQLIHQALELAQQFFTENIPRAESAVVYLESRGISRHWIKELGIGFAPDTWEGLATFFRDRGAVLRHAVTAGLLKMRTSGGYYDTFRSRITIPIRDLSGRIVAFGGRIFGDGDPKYLNSPESLVFRKKNILFGLDSAREAIRSTGTVSIVEGYFDQIALRIRGIENVAATLGTALGADQIRLLKRFTTNIVTIFDGDEAGLRAVKRSIPLFLAEGIEPRCLILTDDKDPDEAVRRVGADEFNNWITGARPGMDYLLGLLAKNFNLNSMEGRNSALEECIPSLREIADSKERDYVIERFSSTLKIREDRLRRLISGATTFSRKKAESRKTLFDFPADERNIVRGMLLREGFIDRVIESGLLKDITDPILSRIAGLMVQFYQDTGSFDPMAFSYSLEDANLSSIIAAWLNPRPEEDDLRPDVDGDLALDDSLDSLRSKKLQKRKAEIQECMKTSAPGGEEFNSLARELWVIGQHLRK